MLGRGEQSMESLDLGGLWNIRSTDGLFALSGTVPGSLFDDLERSGYFGTEGMFWRENNRRCLEVADRDFLWARSFVVPETWASGTVALECDGLDTLAEIRINGKVVAKTRNMHRRHRWVLNDLVTPGENRIEIFFGNTLDYVRKAQERRPLWHAYGTSPEIAYPAFNHIRKSHCSYGWDWGPIVPDVGIWRDIRLVHHEGPRIADWRIHQDHLDGAVSLDVFVSLENAEETSWEVVLTDPQGKVQRQETTGTKVRLAVTNPQLWWPNGLGAQPLYRLDLRLKRLGRVVDHQSCRVGLRTLTVDRSSDEWGQKFEFVVNGQPFFAMGGDYIPEDVALARVGRDRTEGLIQDCVAAHFNCLRVWGGGVYPSETFFDLCDEYGLVVWQDLMFACAVYDVKNPEFQREIVEEVRDNLRRIRHRACLGLVCGNNEMEQGFVEWDIQPTPEQRTEYLLQYQTLFPQVIAEVCPDVFYWPASPSSGGDFDDPNAPDRGDCHFWAVWHGNKDFSEYTKHYFRFMSEFGFESFPDLKTIHDFTVPEDRNVFSPVMEDHQRCVGGNGKIFTYISKYFRYPKDFASVVYVSQISQSEAQRSGIEHWRRNRGRCMGSVYWQVNDNWPVASWSSIDSAGRWKLMHYAAKRAYAPQLLSCVAGSEQSGPLPAGNGHFTVTPAVVELHFSNESAQVSRGHWEWSLILTSGEEISRGQGTGECSPFSSTTLTVLDLRDVVNGAVGSRQSLLFYSMVLDSGVTLHGFYAFVPYKMLDLQVPNVTAKWVSGPDELGTIVVQSQRPGIFVQISHPEIDVVLDDNGFGLDGTHEVRVPIRKVQDGRPVPSTGWQVRTLFDTY